MQTIKLRVFLFLSIGFLLSCNSKKDRIEVSKKDSIESIVSNPESPKKYTIKNCNCSEFPELNDYISCDTTIFSNGAKIYRQFSCDSSWLVFENEKRKKNIYSLDKEMIEYTHKLGYTEWEEYECGILVAERLISGTGSPYDYYLLNKENGKVVAKLGRDVFKNEDKNFPIFVSIDADAPTSLNFFNLKNKTFYNFPLKEEKFQKALLFDNYSFHPEELFDKASINNAVFKVYYFYKMKEKDDWKYDEIIVDLNKVDFN